MFQTIVLALDGSTSSDLALECAAEIARESGGQIHVVHVVEIMVGRAAGPANPAEADIKAKIRQQVADLVGSGIKADLEFHSATLGGPAAIIAETADRVDANAIVCGTRGHTLIGGMLLGSVPLRLLHIAKCPVMVVPVTFKARSATRARSAAAAAG
jgi:nucleotide-binding universal stress UspA family protein